ncbi:hypothetical protein VHEMI08006 [[Torrubiella] hemipterigena]|uniref:Gag1-like clamp domain-containing protein n=1 Tax=[Torrubiella] hemipterigena TaxID=1531966 RepID=A0A0A1TC48_9HYPO|nr:hypothetical protein VHEMI08006 [[Torrubiella] hemipterigena]
MMFSELYKGSLALRSESPLNPKTPAEWTKSEYADLYSKDKVKQKEAVRRYLKEKVRTNWEFPAAINGLAQRDTSMADLAPEPDSAPAAEDHNDDALASAAESDGSDAESIYSIVSEDEHYRPRAEWTSDVEELRELQEQGRASTASRRSDSGAKAANQQRLFNIRARRRREVREEMKENPGLAIFEARRDAWTGARTVRVRTKPNVSPPASPRSPRRFFFRRSMSTSPPNAVPSPIMQQLETASDTSSIAKDDGQLSKKMSVGETSVAAADPKTFPVETLLPLAQPILPPENGLRACITPATYHSLYDKIVLHNMTPSCPINLADMMQTCVSGWKRDGEWPPKMSAPEPLIASRKPKKKEVESPTSRRLSFGLRTKDKDDEARTKGFRKSLQRALGFGTPQAVSGGN